MRIPQYDITEADLKGMEKMKKEEEWAKIIENMTPTQRAYFEEIVRDINALEQERLNEEEEECTKALYNIDMVQGFVNMGAMSNPAYNALVPEQLRMIDKFRKENELVTFICEGHDLNALEFKDYPVHCVDGTEEAELIPEFRNQIVLPKTRVIKKNCINGVLVDDTRAQIKRLKNLKEVVFEGVCTDLCVMDFARTYARYLDLINHEAKLFVVKNAIDTFDAPGHDRKEWTNIALKVMEQAGIEVVENIEHLEEREKQLGLYRG